MLEQHKKEEERWSIVLKQFKKLRKTIPSCSCNSRQSICSIEMHWTILCPTQCLVFIWCMLQCYTIYTTLHNLYAHSKKQGTGAYSYIVLQIQTMGLRIVSCKPLLLFGQTAAIPASSKESTLQRCWLNQKLGQYCCNHHYDFIPDNYAAYILCTMHILFNNRGICFYQIVK